MKSTIKLLVVAVLCFCVMLAFASCSLIFTPNVNNGSDNPAPPVSGGDHKPETDFSSFEIVNREVMAYNSDGERINFDREFVEYETNTYYVINNFVVVGDYIVEGKAYRFDDGGVMLDEMLDNIFVECEGATYYVINNIVVYDQIVIDGYVYDFGDDGKMVTGENGDYTYGDDGKFIANEIFITINNNTYYIINNITVYNMIIIDGFVYDFGDDGKMVVGTKGDYTYGDDGKLNGNNIFVTINNNIYYIINNVIVYNRILIDGSIYDFGDDGKMVTGEKDGYTYGDDGKMIANEIFVTFNGNVYYFLNNITVYNQIVIDGSLYNFGSDGVMITGQNSGYNYGDDGKLIGDCIFVTINNNTYYIINNIVVFNQIVINGYVYDFGDDGVMFIGVKGEYTYGDDGRLIADKIFITINNNTYYIINNITIYNFGTYGADGDCDNDGLSNRGEIDETTDPFNADTDGDGANDGSELSMGFNPLEYNSSFGITKVPVVDNSDEPDTVVPKLEIELSGDQMNSLVVERDDFFDEGTLGYLGDAYNYSVEGSFGSATIGFEFNPEMLGSNALPTIYAYDKESGRMTPLATTIDGNVATAEVSELSTYVILDRSVYENDLEWVDIWGLDGSAYTSVEIVFVVDDSGSMTSNDGSYKRLSVARDLISQLPDGSKIGVVKFASSTTKLTTSLTTDKNVAKNYLTTTYFRSSGVTYMYEAINSSVSLYSTPTEGDGVMRVMVVLSDGSPSSSSYLTTATNAVKNAGIAVYTVGLGSSTTAFNNHLKPLSNSTGGNFYLASNASGLSSIFDDIGEKIDLTTDTDKDGLLDYYEDNMIVFDGNKYEPDKTKADTDGDGLLDGEEIRTVVIISMDGEQMTIIGKVYSDPTKVDSDNDGVNDKEDSAPLDADVA